MVAPGPGATTLEKILKLAMRTPDHGKLFPWRFVIIDDRTAFTELLERAFVKSNPDARPAQIDAAVSPSRMAPTLVLLLFAPQTSAKIPLWEQQMSVGAVGMNLLHAAHSEGFVASWITGWASYDDVVRESICTGSEQIAGLFFMGSPAQVLEERPRPEPSEITRYWP